MSDNIKKEDIDAMTHPSVYRDTVNERVNSKVTGGNVSCSKSNEKKYENDWDLYPQMIRKVENEGNSKQIEHLHQLEHTSSR
jgi:hypothetical protein